MMDLLQVVGSVASIIAVPLAVYLFLRQREAWQLKLRQDICRALSYQLGEGRELSHFEIAAVIESKSREFRARPSKITYNEVIEDLAAETVSNPMLDSSRKTQILGNLTSLHSAVGAYAILQRYKISPDALLRLASQAAEVPERDRILIARAARTSQGVREREPAAFSGLFGWTAAMVSGLGLVAAISGADLELFRRLLGQISHWEVGIVVGIVSSIIAGLFSVALSRRSRRTDQGAGPRAEQQDASDEERSVAPDPV